ncbi:MAG: response regulator transcription factor [Chitinophagaceae bacterium]|nr:response regulator transcription factor [Chitinophagaceae bacterium]
MQATKIALADDHVLLRTALATLINSFENCKVIQQAGDGDELIEQIRQGCRPDVVILDLNMPRKDGHETAIWLKDNFPQIHVMMLTMYDSESALIRLLQAGVKGFLKKDIHPSELKFAIQSVIQSGYYYSHNTSGKLANLFRTNGDKSPSLHKNMLTEQEVYFLKLASSELTYKEIAQKMGLNPRSVDSLRDHLFDKLDVRSRVGLAMYAIRHGIIAF